MATPKLMVGDAIDLYLVSCLLFQFLMGLHVNWFDCPLWGRWLLL